MHHDSKQSTPPESSIVPLDMSDPDKERAAMKEIPLTPSEKETVNSPTPSPSAGALGENNNTAAGDLPGGGGPPGFGGLPFQFPTGMKLYSTIFAMYIAGFLTVLDRTIIVTAIPTIINHFDSIGDIGWYGSAYLLIFCAFQLLFSKVYSFEEVLQFLNRTYDSFHLRANDCSVSVRTGRTILGSCRRTKGVKRPMEVSPCRMKTCRHSCHFVSSNLPFTTNSASRSTTRNSSNNVSSSKNLKLIMLHGFTQSGSLFKSKTQTLREGLSEAILPAASKYYDIKFVFPTAPFALERDALPSFDIDGASKQDEEIDAYTRWHITGQKPPFRYEGIETAMSHIAETIIREGPFDGAMGFSQGAAVTAMVASLLESGRKLAFENAQADGSIPFPPSLLRQGVAIQPPLRFAIAFSGFGGIQNTLYSAFYNPKINTPMLHVLGKTDNFIKPAMSQELIDRCANTRVARHLHGHSVPNELGCVDEVARFLKEVLEL